ncbi:MAG: FeoB-associated Cys-rich membrane protein [Clostridia bacterium]|nr:FeoB-associated Cys-rich membrane protein [Clostridia bacterium]
MENYIIIAVVLLIVALAGIYIYKAKKSGKKCIGCPYSDSCAKSCGCGCSQTESK